MHHQNQQNLASLVMLSQIIAIKRKSSRQNAISKQHTLNYLAHVKRSSHLNKVPQHKSYIIKSKHKHETNRWGTLNSSQLSDSDQDITMHHITACNYGVSPYLALP